MKKEYVTLHSKSLNKDMRVAVYGDQGTPVLAFPTQDSDCDRLEAAGMIDTIGDWLAAGQIQVFVPDTVDPESWSALYGDNPHRACRQEEYYHFIIDEVLPLIHETNNTGTLPVACGFSMGALHASIVFLRQPELFSGLLAISGVYNSDYFFGDWMDPILYDNTPTAFMAHMPADHPYIKSYNSKRIIFCVGQGAREYDQITTLHELEISMRRLGIHAWFDFWGFDVSHDWDWWKKMVRYHLPRFFA